MTAGMLEAAEILCERRPDGVRVLRSTQPLEEYPGSLGDVLRGWATRAPERVLAGERTPDDSWRTVTYGQATESAEALAQSLLDLGSHAGRPVVVLSGNSVHHLLITLAGYLTGIPVVPVSVAYSLRSQDFARLRAIAELVGPGVVFAADGRSYGDALRVVVDTADGCVPVVARDPQPGQRVFDELLRTPVTGDVRRAGLAVTPDTVAKILFTSGSTGLPKGVRNTHRMLCANQQMLRQIWPFVAEEPPVLTDWLPWSHTFGGNHNLNLALYNGGSIYIDDGQPAPDRFDRTVEALRAVPPTICVNVPAGYAMLADRVERDPELGERIFSRARMLLYAGADMATELRTRLGTLAASCAGREIDVISSWGATETGPGATSTYGASRTGIGVPLPGVSVKLAPHGLGFETRVSGPSVTPGYLGGRGEDAFDEEGYYRTGDMTRLVDEDAPWLGLAFEGRIAENFKLANATWISAGSLRRLLLGAADVLSETVIVGSDRPYVTALGWLNLDRANESLGTSATDVAELFAHNGLRARLADALAALNADAAPSSRVHRLLLVAEPPRIDRGEITDKGYVNTAVVLDNRREVVESLYADPADPAIITPSDGRGRR